jgi:hypothetical protein
VISTLAVRSATCLAVLLASPALGQSLRISTDTLDLGSRGRPFGEPHLTNHPSRAGHLLGVAMVHDPTARLSDSTRARIRCASFVSTDDGRTWQTHLFDIIECFDPWVSITPNGDAVLTALGRDPKFPGQTDALVVYHSADGGRTWDAQPVSLGAGHDHPMTVVDRSDPKRASWLYVVSSLAARADNGVLRFGLSVSRSRNGGRTFDPPVFLRPTTLMAKAESPAVLSDGTLVLSYVEPALGDGATKLVRQRAWLMQSRDGGFDFSRPTFINEACGDSSRGFSLSSLAAGPSELPSSDRLYFACNQSRPSAIVLSASPDRGQSWSAAKSIDGAVDSLSRKKLMAMAVNASGVLGVVWSESGRNSAGPCAEDIYFADSFDGGKSFQHPERVAISPSCADAAVNGSAWAGDYFGLVGDNQDRFRLLWSGIRNGRFQLHLSTIVVTPASK